MYKFLLLGILIFGIVSLDSAYFEVRPQSKNFKSTPNSEEQIWIAIDNKSISTVGAKTSTTLEHIREVMVSPEQTEIYFAQVTEADLTRFIKLNPNEPSAYFYRGLVRIEARNYKGAEADYTQVIRLKQNDTDAHNRRGLLRQELENYQGAEADFTQAIKLDPKDVDAYNNRSIVRKVLKNYQGAEVDLQVAARLNRQQNNAGSRISQADAYIRRVIVYTDLNNLSSFPTTEADYIQAIKLNFNDAEAYFHRGFIRIETKNYRGAETDFTQVIKLTPTAADAYTNRGLIRKELKNYQGAETDFTQAIKLFPDEANVYTNRGLLRIEAENYPGASTDFQKAAQLYRQQNKIDEYKQTQKILNQLQALLK